MHQSGRLPSAAGRSNPGTTPVLAHKNPLNFSRFGTEVQWHRHSCVLALTKEGCAPRISCGGGSCHLRPPPPFDLCRPIASPSLPFLIDTRNNRISNRHLVRLEVTATPTKSTSSLFLIDTKQRNCFASIALPAHRRCCERSAHRRADLQLRRPVAATPASSASAVADHLRRAEVWRARQFLAPFAHAFDVASTPLPFGPASAASISNRHLVQLEIAVSDRKQSPVHVSNRPKLAALNSVSISRKSLEAAPLRPTV